MASGNEDDRSKTPVEAAKSFLSSLLNKQLFIHTTDERIFVGDFKCTDNVMSPLP